ncbi:MAG TPA: UvrD-helicase domain-containing protein [Thermoanaerobaculia bacterium]|nr:UvrD-helicase domain-containing protein [Thermoanaerobaculia bacterium]
MTRIPDDQGVRDAIAKRLETTMLVEAAAGTGKTTSLVERMTALVATGKARASTLSAITFTIKSAAQLREKFQESVERKLRGSEEPMVQERLRAALHDIDRGFIGTTHAFCARLLRERPVEAGLDPEFEEVEEVIARQITHEFWNNWWAEEAAKGSALLAETRAIGLDRQLLRQAFEKIVEHPDVTFVSSRATRPDLRSVCDELCAFIDECKPHLPTDADRDIPDDFERMIVALGRQRGSLDLHDLSSQLRFLDEGNHASRKPTQKRWPDGKVAKRLGEDYKAFATGTLRPALQRWREYVHGVAIELLRPAAIAFAAERRRKGTLTFQDLLLCARDMLRDHPAVRRYFQRRFTHLLVDEFQDTDPLQAEVMLFLTAGDTLERNWRKLEPRPGSLFIVGDPKQSIYRFRRADITTYLEVKRRIEASGGVVMQLGTNFRSAPSICSFVNEAFTSIFTAADVEAGRQAVHVDLHPFREAGAPAGVYSLETAPGRNEDMAEAEARCVADWIRRSVDAGMTIDDEGVSRPVRWSDFLLVSWGRKRLPSYARVFEELSLPYEITGSRAFDGAPELRTAMPLLRAVVDFDDMVSIVAFLRGPLCGVDDDALYRFYKAGGRFSPFRPPPEGTDAKIVHGLSVLREAIEDSRQHPPAAAVGRLFERLGLLPLSVSGDQAGTRSGALVLALTIARELSARGESLASVVNAWDDLLNSPPDIEELDIDPARADAVRLMNLHQVKGLEAPIVFLIDPADEYDHPVDLFVDRSSDESHGYFVLSKEWDRGSKPIAQPPDWDRHVQTETAFKAAEKNRLLYVAATRAKHLLIVGFRKDASGVAGAWRELAVRAKQVLFSPPNAGVRGVVTTAVVHQFEEARADLALRFETGRASSYSVLPITKIAHGSHAELVRAEEGLGKGTSWGRVLHRMFEAMLLNDNVDVALLASNLLKDEERDSVELDEVMRVVEAVQGSPLWARVKAAQERFVEVPFALLVPRSEIGLEGEGDTLLHGVIDLVFREDSRWFVVDYKSDSTKGRLPSLIEYYRPQVEHYTRFWGRLTGAETTGGLFFVDITKDVWL